MHFLIIVMHMQFADIQVSICNIPQNNKWSAPYFNTTIKVSSPDGTIWLPRVLGIRVQPCRVRVPPGYTLCSEWPLECCCLDLWAGNR